MDIFLSRLTLINFHIQYNYVLVYLCRLDHLYFGQRFVIDLFIPRVGNVTRYDAYLKMFVPTDIIFCRTWCNVEVPKLYNPVTSLLSTPDEKTKWSGMKRLGQLKREKGVKHDPQLDSLYTVTLNSELSIS